MKKKLYLIVILLLVVFAGKNHAHEEQQAQIDVLLELINVLNSQNTILRKHRHIGCITTDSFNHVMSLMKKAYKELGQPEDYIENYVSAYRETAKVCGEETDITYKNFKLSRALFLQSRLMKTHKTVACYPRETLNSALAEIRKNYEEAEFLTGKNLEDHVDWLRRTSQICEEN